MDRSDLDMVVAGSGAVLIVESDANELSEDLMIEQFFMVIKK